MSMKIKEIQDYCYGNNGKGTTSPRGAGVANNPPKISHYEVQNPINPKVKAIAASNYQIYVYANGTNAIIKIKDQSILTENRYGTYACLCVFDLDSDNKPVNIVTTPSTSVEALATFIANNLPSYPNRFFAIVALNQTINTNTVNYLSSHEDFNIQNGISTNLASYVAVGFNGSIIDSMINGGEVNGISQLYVNGKNIIAGSVFSSPVSATSPAYVGFPLQEIEYIVLQHCNTYGSTGNFIIKNHAISVVTETGQKIVKQSSNDYIETIHGSRHYLFEALNSDNVITAGYVSSISMYGTQSAAKRGIQQQFVSFFNDTIITNNDTDVSQIVRKIRLFNINGSPNTSIEMINKSNYELAIRRMNEISYDKANCNAGCFYQCADNCYILCSTACGINCGTLCDANCLSNCMQTCANSCDIACNTGCNTTCMISCGNACEQVCYSICGNNCVGVCRTTCTTTCKDNCTVGCKDTCNTGCLNGCYGSCVSGCSRDCDGGCQGWCVGGCGARCDGRCKGSCENTCHSTCRATCQGSCSESCTNQCIRNCGSSCSADCNNGCNTACGSICLFNCLNGCSTVCRNSCSVMCMNTCNKACGFNCDTSCKKGCSVLCETQCVGSCVRSCSNNCISSAGGIAYL